MLKTWLIANLGIVYVVCALIILGLSAIFLPLNVAEGETSAWILAIYLIGAISVIMLFAAEPSIGPVISVFLLVGLFIFLIISMKHPSEGTPIDDKSLRIINIVFISLSVISAIPAFFIARYTNMNFDDVVSRRWMYRNSAKDVFESTWKYTFNRFCMAFLVVFCLLLDLAIIVVLAVAEHSVGLDSLFH